MDIETKYRAFRALGELVQAEQHLDDARKMLIQARLTLQAAGLQELARRLTPMISALYADEVRSEGGSMEAWDLRVLALRVGAEAVDAQE